MIYAYKKIKPAELLKINPGMLRAIVAAAVNPAETAEEVKGA